MCQDRSIHCFCESMLKELKIKYTKHEIKEELKTKICIKHNRKKEFKTKICIKHDRKKELKTKI